MLVIPTTVEKFRLLGKVLIPHCSQIEPPGEASWARAAFAHVASVAARNGAMRRRKSNALSWLRWSALRWGGRLIGIRRPMQFGFVHAGLTGVPTFFVVDQAPSPMAFAVRRG